MRKIILLIGMLLLPSYSYPTAATDIIKNADDLIAKKKYNSAFQLLLRNDENKTDIDVVLKKIDIALNYFAQSIMHQQFALVDIDENRDIMDVRGKPGSYSLYTLPVDTILSELIKKNPDNGKLYYALGNYYYEVKLKYSNRWLISDKELLEKAKTNFLKAQKLNVYDYYSLFVIGAIAVENNDVKSAKRYFLDSIKMNQDYASSVYNLAYLYYLENDYKNSIPCAKKAFDLYSDNEYKSDAAKMLGNIYLKNSDYQSAVVYFSRGIELYPDDFYTHNGLLITYLTMNKIDDANAAADKMFARHPTWPNVTKFITDDYLGFHQEKELEKFFARNLSVYKENEILGNLCFYQAAFYSKINNIDKSKDSFIKAKEHFSKVFKPDHPVFKTIDNALSEYDNKR